MMINEKAYAKLNISLDVSRPREDGYHDMVMVMQAISLCDDISLSLTDDAAVKASCNLPYIPGDERNLAVKAAKLFLREIGREDAGMRITINKRIPVGAGMAGGSSDAAAVLRGMNRLFDHALAEERLMALAGMAGSDVPFCLLGGTALAEGRGEVLTGLPPLPECTIVVCKPEFSISTPELFHALDKVRLRTHPDTAGIVAALENGSLKDVCRRMYNVFEAVPDRRMKTAAGIERILLSAGAEGAIMTGTGSAVFGIFTGEAAAAEACTALSAEYPFVCTAKPVGKLL